MVDAGCALSPDDVVVQSPAYFGVLETLGLLGMVLYHPTDGCTQWGAWLHRLVAQACVDG